LNSKVLSSAILGIDAYVVEVECHITGSKLPKFITVGLPEGAVKESKERVSAAIQNSGYKLPGKHIINFQGNISRSILRQQISEKKVLLLIFP